MAPTQRRRKLPEIVLDALCDWLMEKREIEASLYLQVAFSLYLRPSENSRLTLGDFIAPGDATRYYGMVLAPFERGISSKIGSFDEAVLLDDVRSPWLGEAIARHIVRRKLQLHREGVSKKDMEVQPATLWRAGATAATRQAKDPQQAREPLERRVLRGDAREL